eukprot:tig00021612_g22875.t1
MDGEFGEFPDSFEGDNLVDSDGPGLEDLTQDESLTEMQRLERYLTSSVALQRLSHIKDIGIHVRAGGFSESRAALFPLLQKLSEDEQDIRASFARQLSEIAALFVEHDAYSDVENVLLPLSVRLLNDDLPQVREAACDGLIQMAPLLRSAEVEGLVLPLFVKLAAAECEDTRCLAAKALNEVAEWAPREVIERVVLPEIEKLCEDSVFRVRKVQALNLDRVAHTVGAETTTARIVPLFAKLAEDEVWGVRKACAEAVVALSNALAPEARVSTLLPIVEKYTQDASRWVRTAVLQQLGPFLATLRGGDIPASALSSYTAMATQTQDPELCRFCAFNFPAVALTLGRERWGELKGTYETLAADQQWKVRRTLAFSVHEMARILGPEVTAGTLLPIFDGFLKDLDEVKVGVVRHLAAFLRLLEPEARARYLPAVEAVAREENWRFRKLLAKQLEDLAAIFDAPALPRVLLPVALRLCRDPVHRVRHRAHTAAAALFCVTARDPMPAAVVPGEEPAPHIALLGEIQKFAGDRSFVHRQTYVRICEEVCVRMLPPAPPSRVAPSSGSSPARGTPRGTPRDATPRTAGPSLEPREREQESAARAAEREILPRAVERELLPLLGPLAHDRVPNVRIALARLLSGPLRSHPFFVEHGETVALLDLLGQDRDRDVRHFASLPPARAPSPSPSMAATVDDSVHDIDAVSVASAGSSGSVGSAGAPLSPARSASPARPAPDALRSSLSPSPSSPQPGAAVSPVPVSSGGSGGSGGSGAGGSSNNAPVESTAASPVQLSSQSTKHGSSESRRNSEDGAEAEAPAAGGAAQEAGHGHGHGHGAAHPHAPHHHGHGHNHALALPEPEGEELRHRVGRASPEGEFARFPASPPPRNGGTPGSSPIKKLSPSIALAHAAPAPDASPVFFPALPPPVPDAAVAPENVLSAAEAALESNGVRSTFARRRPPRERAHEKSHVRHRRDSQPRSSSGGEGDGGSVSPVDRPRSPADSPMSPASGAAYPPTLSLLAETEAARRDGVDAPESPTLCHCGDCGAHKSSHHARQLNGWHHQPELLADSPGH